MLGTCCSGWALHSCGEGEKPPSPQAAVLGEEQGFSQGGEELEQDLPAEPACVLG